jgi:CheY-like chemotaxis protein
MTQSLPPKSLVLYADDDRDDIELISEAFEKHVRNVELVTFENGLELLHYIEYIHPFQPAPCLIILDINMPGLDGKQTLKRLRNMDGFSDVPAVLFSTSTLPSDAAFAHSFDAGFVTKPLLSEQVHLIIDQIIEHCNDDVKKMIRKSNNRK